MAAAWSASAGCWRTRERRSSSRRDAARGHGLAKAVAATLAHRLADEGVGILGATDENPAACRAYEAIGFHCFDRRVQLNLGAA
jgi:ribosomal protein S18 acetylase RimI-like enzyme